MQTSPITFRYVTVRVPNTKIPSRNHVNTILNTPIPYRIHT
nr:hypothetical protein MACL_00002400 [Theileria orientalis]